MTPDKLIGRSLPFIVGAIGSRVATLLNDARDVVPLPVRELPAGSQVGDELTVFITRGADGELVATTATPLVELNQVRFLTASALTPVGPFFDWGLGKELLVPYAEQTQDVRVGARHAIGLIVGRDGRLVGTMRVAELLREPRGGFEAGDWVDGEAWRNDPEIGLFVILDRSYIGLLPASEPHRLKRGEAASFRVSRVLPDGRVSLSLREPAHEALDRDAEHLLAVLSRRGAPGVNDKSSPEQIRAVFGLAKKAFKRAAGRLLKEERIALDDAGFYRPKT